MTEADGAMPGMQYSDAVYTVRITPHDQGDGTMTTDVVIEDAAGVELTADQKPLFERVCRYGQGGHPGFQEAEGR